MDFKQLQILPNQKLLLISMCADLFPNKTFEICEVEDALFLTIDKSVRIHWLEFCMFHLSRAIAENYNTVYPDEKQAFIIDLMMKKMLNFSKLDKVHPIDFLFEVYQKSNK
jgi:hypothetical protein